MPDSSAYGNFVSHVSGRKDLLQYWDSKRSDECIGFTIMRMIYFFVYNKFNRKPYSNRTFNRNFPVKVLFHVGALMFLWFIILFCVWNLLVFFFIIIICVEINFKVFFYRYFKLNFVIVNYLCVTSLIPHTYRWSIDLVRGV